MEPKPIAATLNAGLRILVWLGYLELFGFLAIINMQEGKTAAWRNGRKSKAGWEEGWTWNLRPMFKLPVCPTEGVTYQIEPHLG